jgi:hypothetical protein
LTIAPKISSAGEAVNQLYSRRLDVDVQRPALDVVRVDVGSTEAESGRHAWGAIGELLLVREARARVHDLLLEVDTGIHCEFGEVSSALLTSSPPLSVEVCTKLARQKNQNPRDTRSELKYSLIRHRLGRTCQLVVRVAKRTASITATAAVKPLVSTVSWMILLSTL